MVLKEMTLGVSQFSSGWSGEGLITLSCVIKQILYPDLIKAKIYDKSDKRHLYSVQYHVVVPFQ